MQKFIKSKLFQNDVYVDGNWDFSTISNFPKTKILACDTETKLFKDGKLIDANETYNFYKKCVNDNDLNLFRKKINVVCYCVSISDGDNFAIFQNINDFLTAITMMRVKYCVWYNAKFDFTLFDYYFLINKWTNKSDLYNESKGEKIKTQNNMYESLNGEFGERYQMKIWKSYKNNSRNEKIHKTTFIDLCNVLKGGLKKNLIDFDIKDNNGNDIRKLEMQYDYADLKNPNDIQYIKNDTNGLYFLTIKFDNICKELTNFSFLNGDYITIGGLAKKVMLQFMFKCQYPKNNIKAYKYYLPMTIKQDLNYRNNYLYKGGLSFVNYNYLQMPLKNIYKYDINSMYPHKMLVTKIPFGNPKIITYRDDFIFKNSNCYILKLRYLMGELKDNAIPLYMDCLTNDFVFSINELDGRFIWYEEFEMYKMYYDLDYEIEYIIEFVGVYSKGLQEFVNKYYDIKDTTTNKSLKQVVKLILNSSYGKLSQRVQDSVITYTLDKTYGFLKTEKHFKDIEKLDDSSLLSIVHGSRITALSRVNLGHEIMRICKNNPKKYFVYCDTDSVHSLCPYTNIDNHKIGKMKFEGKYENAIYLAPKTYLLNNGNDYECHTKGVNTDVVLDAINDKIKAGATFSDIINQVFKENVKFKCLNALNVRGGRALFYVDKCIMKNDIADDGELLNLSKQDTDALK